MNRSSPFVAERQIPLQRKQRSELEIYLYREEKQWKSSNTCCCKNHCCWSGDTDARRLGMPFSNGCLFHRWMTLAIYGLQYMTNYARRVGRNGERQPGEHLDGGIFTAASAHHR